MNTASEAMHDQFDGIGVDGFPVSLSYFTAMPDLSTVNDSRILMDFKSMMKKDSVTKEKSMNDLIEYLEKLNDTSGVTLDDVTIICWVQLYAKLSIDNSRNVRALAHSIQSLFVTTVGGKSFSKYLKSSISIWLQGLYDPDRFVSSAANESLEQAFQGSKEKLEVQVWVTFARSISNYIYHILIAENSQTLSDHRYVSEDDAVAKYERTLNGCLSMLIRLITLANEKKLIIKPGDETLITLEQILESDALWNIFSTFNQGGMINTHLFKSYFTLIQVLFIDTDNIFTNSINVASIYKICCRKLLKHIKFKTSKDLSSTIIFSGIIVMFWKTLQILTVFPLISKVKVKKGIWQLGGKNGYSRFLNYLKIGECNSGPQYYETLKEFFASLAKVNKKINLAEDFIDFGSLPEAEMIVFEVLLPKFDRATINTKVSFVECVLEIIKSFFDSADFIESADFSSFVLKVVMFYLDQNYLNNRLRDNVMNIIELFLMDLMDKRKIIEFFEILYAQNINLLDCGSDSKAEIFKPKNELSFISNSAFLISICTNARKNLISLFDAFVSQINLSCHVILQNQKSSYIINFLTIFLNSITKNMVNFDEETEKLIQWLIISAEESCVEDFSRFFNSLIRHDSFNMSKSSKIIDPLYEKFSKLDTSKLAEFLCMCSKSGLIKKENIKSDFSYIYSLVIEAIRKPMSSADEKQILRSFLYLDEVLERALDLFLAESDEDLLQIIYDCLKTQNAAYINSSMKSHIIKVLEYCLENLISCQSQKFIILSVSVLDSNSIKTAIFNHVTKTKESVLFDDLVSFFYNSGFDCEAIIPYEDFEAAVKVSVKKIENNLISVANPLGFTMYLCKREPGNEFSLSSFPVRIGQFCSAIIRTFELNKNRKTNLILVNSIIMEYCADYIFLRSEDDEEISNQAMFDLRNELRSQLESNLDVNDINSVLNIIKNTPDDSYGSTGLEVFTFLNQVIDFNKEPSYSQFYEARIFKFILDYFIKSNVSACSEFASSLAFDSLRRNKLKFSILLSSFSGFLVKNSSFSKHFNLSFSCLIGIKEKNIYTEGIENLILSLNFLNLDAENINERVPLHRLTLVLNDISKWLGSSVCFEANFIELRCLLCLFISSLLQYLSDFPEILLSLTKELILSNFSMIEAEPERVELRYYTFKLLSVFGKLDAASLVDEEFYTEFQRSFLDIVCNDELLILDHKLANQPIILVNDLEQRLLDIFVWNVKITGEYEEQLFEKLEEAKSQNFQLLVCRILSKILSEKQKETFISFELKRKAISDEDELQNSLDIPKKILSCAVVSNLDSRSLGSDVSRAIYSWALIMNYFEGASFAMKQQYSSILMENCPVSELLDFMFQESTFLDSSYFRSFAKAGPDELTRLSKQIQSSIFVQGNEEDLSIIICVNILQLYYLLLVNLGSDVRSWLNNIRDKQLKSKLEAFTSRFVSPLIVTQILDDVMCSKERLINDEEGMSLKVNYKTYEVRASYIIDEQTLEMVIKIPKAYPLYNVTLEGSQKLGVKEQQWKAWLLASQKIIALANGSIVNAVELFSRNVKLHFSGFEECAICYSILHQDRSLPNKSCNTCHNKFHASCLYKWFKSSGASSCPLCRSHFNFRQKQ